jgi:hypothetical protein
MPASKMLPLVIKPTQASMLAVIGFIKIIAVSTNASYGELCEAAIIKP